MDWRSGQACGGDVHWRRTCLRWIEAMTCTVRRSLSAGCQKEVRSVREMWDDSQGWTMNSTVQDPADSGSARERTGGLSRY
jgi:hypothetical protein